MENKTTKEILFDFLNKHYSLFPGFKFEALEATRDFFNEREIEYNEEYHLFYPDVQVVIFSWLENNKPEIAVISYR